MVLYRTVSKSVIDQVIDSELLTETGPQWPIYKGEQLIAEDGDHWILCDNRKGFAWISEHSTKQEAIFRAHEVPAWQIRA